MMEKSVKNRISEKRFGHTKRVLNTALELAEIYNVDKERTKIAALLHDYAKYFTPIELIKIIQDSGGKITDLEIADPEILHGPVAAILVKEEFEIYDEEVLESIKYHTTGKANLSTLAKIIYLADAIEPLREYQGVEKIRKKVKDDLDQALLLSLNITLEYLIKKGRLIHPLSIEARNYLILENKE